jgi:hypothetical protein
VLTLYSGAPLRRANKILKKNSHITIKVTEKSA